MVALAVEAVMRTCPLCGDAHAHRSIDGPDTRKYFQCPACSLIYVDPSCYPSAEQERSRYLLHNNSPDDPGYTSFLSQAITPARAFINSRMKCLDYGCGPMPTLSGMLKEEGIECDNYDPFFFPHGMNAERYDAIFSTECFEHFFCPGIEIPRLLTVLKPGGYLVIMTACWDTTHDFSTWTYARDITHVSFYHRDTLRWIARHYQLDIVYDDHARVLIYQHPMVVKNTGGVS